jgi:predicted dehydrogenase
MLASTRRGNLKGATMIKTAVVGLGFMGQTHFNCYKGNPSAQLVAAGDYNPEKLKAGAKVAGNIDSNAALDFSGVRTTSDIESLIHDPEIELIDFCLPTRAHARHAIAALNAGKHVLCEKPLAWTVEECDEVIEAQKASGKYLLIGHCLRFWPQYVRAHEIIQAGELGKVLYARFFRAGGAPSWSAWLMDGAQSGGAVLDMHVHDVDTALWWFGQPDSIRATGLVLDGLPLKVDAAWSYQSGPHVHIHGGWDKNSSHFSMGFELVGDAASLYWDSSRGEAMQLCHGGQTREIEVSGTMAYQAEIDYFLECITRGQAPERITPEGSRLSVAMAREELRQMGFQG